MLLFTFKCEHQSQSHFIFHFDPKALLYPFIFRIFIAIPGYTFFRSTSRIYLEIDDASIACNNLIVTLNEVKAIYYLKK